MFAEIFITQEIITLSFKQGKKTIALTSWTDKNDLSLKFLPEISSLLKKNGIKKNQLSKITLKRRIPKSYTSIRIAESVIKAFAAQK